MIALVSYVAALAGCSSSVLQSRDIRLTQGDTTILLRESGAIIVGKRQVGTVDGEGKVKDARGRVLAWVHQDSVRVRGGGALPFRTDAEGAMWISESAQTQAGLKPIKHRIARDGSVAQSKNARGVPMSGAVTDRTRRVMLLVLLLSANSMWD